MAKELFKTNFKDELPEGPIEAGQTRGMSLREVLDTYLDRPNSLLALLRIYSQRSLSNVAEYLGISADELQGIEKSADLVPFQLVPKLAKIFNVDLKMLLILLGHAKWPDEDEKESEPYQFAMAAQYSGPELQKQEKIDLEGLFKKILESAKKEKEKGRNK